MRCTKWTKMVITVWQDMDVTIFSCCAVNFYFIEWPLQEVDVRSENCFYNAEEVSQITAKAVQQMAKMGKNGKNKGCLKKKCKKVFQNYLGCLE